MLDFPIVDTHLHLWDFQQFNYLWLNNYPPLQRSFLFPDFQAACDPVIVDKMVFLECDIHPSERIDEAKWVASLASENPSIQGIVASCALEKGQEIIPNLEELSGIPQVKGIRRLIQQEDLEFCLNPNFIQGLQLLPEFGFSFDICIYHKHLENIIKMVEQCPEVSFMLDHIGKPNIKDQLFEPWKLQIQELAALPNVYCKISGMVTEADHQNWTEEQLQPYIDWAIACFGWDRVVYGGDWPVSKLATEYPRWVEVLESN